MKTVNRRTVLRASGVAARLSASGVVLGALRRNLRAGERAGIESRGENDLRADQRHGRRRHQCFPVSSLWRGYRAGAVPGAAAAYAVERSEGLRRVHHARAATTVLRAPQSTIGRAESWIGRHEPRARASRPRPASQSEDCLHLNVFTPGLRDHRKRPVLVYFHGGAYNNGSVNSALYDGKRLCHRGDVVVVTVNHRLNAFGFLYLGAIDAEGICRIRQRGHAGPGAGAQVGARTTLPSSAATLPAF